LQLLLQPLAFAENGGVQAESKIGEIFLPEERSEQARKLRSILLVAR
jgi:hypothetical protein